MREVNEELQDTFPSSLVFFFNEMDDWVIFCSLSTITHLPHPSIRIHRFSLLKVSIVQRWQEPSLAGNVNALYW